LKKDEARMIEESIQIEEFTCRMLKGKGKGTPVIFLHGYLFTSDVWREIGALDFLEERNIPFIAVDMPYGAKSICEPKSGDTEDNLKIVEEVAGDEPLIVGASLGGYIALKYSVKNPVKGLFLIAPVRSLENELIKNYPKLNMKTYIIYGEKDKIVSLDEMKKLSDLIKAKLIVYENSDHPAYLNQPSRFKNDLIEFYQLTENKF